MSNKKTLTTKFTEFEANRLTFTDLEENDRSKGQLIAYPRYDHPTLGEGSVLFLQGPWMEIFTYGIPSLGEYYSDDSQRAFIKIPIDMNNPEVELMVKEFKKVDKELGSDEFMQRSFGKKSSKYKYQPIIRESQEDDDGNVKPAYMKLKLDTSWPDGNVKTELYKSELIDNKRVREIVSATNVTEVAKYLSYMTKYKPIFRPVKMWAQNQKMPKPEYGVVFKLLKVEFEPNKSGNNSYSDYMTGDAFIDDEDEDESTQKVQEVKEEKTVFQKTESKAKSSKKVEEDSDEDDDSSDDDSEDDSDSEEAPKKVAAKSAKAKPDDDSDDDSDSEEAPKKVVAKNAKGKAKSAKSKA